METSLNFFKKKKKLSSAIETLFFAPRDMMYEVTTQLHVMKLPSVHCAVPLLEPSLGRGGDVGAVAVREENPLCLVFVLNWQTEKHIEVDIKTTQCFLFFFVTLLIPCAFQPDVF